MRIIINKINKCTCSPDITFLLKKLTCRFLFLFCQYVASKLMLFTKTVEAFGNWSTYNTHNFLSLGFRFLHPQFITLNCISNRMKIWTNTRIGQTGNGKKWREETTIATPSELKSSPSPISSLRLQNNLGDAQNNKHWIRMWKNEGHIPLWIYGKRNMLNVKSYVSIILISIQMIKK